MTDTTTPSHDPALFREAGTQVHACEDAYQRAWAADHADFTRAIGMTVQDRAGQERWVLDGVRRLPFGRVGAVFTDLLASTDYEALSHFVAEGEAPLRKAFSAEYPHIPAWGLVILGGGWLELTDTQVAEGEATARALRRH